MPGWSAGGGAKYPSAKLPSEVSMTGRQMSGAGSSMSVADVQNRVDAVKGIMYALLFNFTPLLP